MKKEIRSTRTSPRIEEMWAVVVFRDGMEGVVRRDTPHGTQPWMTDDSRLTTDMLRMAKEASGFTDAYLAYFRRER